MPLSRLHALSHDLAPHYPALRAIRTRRQLLRSELWARLGDEISRVLSGVEQGEHPEARGPRRPGRLRVVAWNIMRGARFEALLGALRSDPVLAEADVLLLVEVDQGLGRSGNRMVARELAEALGMSFAFGVSYLTLEDDVEENPDGVENTLSLAGCAILSRVPMARVANVDLPELRDKFSSSEKRLGHKRALCAELLLEGGPLVIGCCHLDSTSSPAQRASQLAALLDHMNARLVPGGPARALVGGDWNTSTYDYASTGALVRDLLHKLIVVGFDGTIARYMTPDRHQDRPAFAVAEERGYTTEELNDRSRGTYAYDLTSAYAIAKVRQYVGGLMLRWLQRRLRPWGGVVPVHLDWFAGRGVRAQWAGVVDAGGDGGAMVSDHAAIAVDLDLQQVSGAG